MCWNCRISPCNSEVYHTLLIDNYSMMKAWKNNNDRSVCGQRSSLEPIISSHQ